MDRDAYLVRQDGLLRDPLRDKRMVVRLKLRQEILGKFRTGVGEHLQRKSVSIPGTAQALRRQHTKGTPSSMRSSRAPKGEVIKCACLPPMYDYEFHPQSVSFALRRVDDPVLMLHSSLSPLLPAAASLSELGGMLSDELRQQYLGSPFAL